MRQTAEPGRHGYVSRNSYEQVDSVRTLPTRRDRRPSYGIRRALPRPARADGPGALMAFAGLDLRYRGKKSSRPPRGETRRPSLAFCFAFKPDAYNGSWPRGGA
ncbi:Hypothetical protein SCLAV_4957 [Streptomyces clavuligerus]|uniref:Uncharacterized protein n=1 Tax=Streptomyces clavuligerus TaxID=1901 RepID=E2PW40_STRCL|nr:Hypothetical protein SCLAV_4957 [Streptomyces clavuligerus]